MRPLLGCFFIFIVSVLCALIATPAIMWAARRIGLIDRPGVRKVHTSAVTRLGGVGIVLSFMMVFCGVILADGDLTRSSPGTHIKILSILCGALCMAALGIADDIIRLRARYKLLGQLVVAIAVCAIGIRIQTIHLGSLNLQLQSLSWPLTILWIIGITNAMNLIDGLDGLAAGIAAVACAVVAILAFRAGETMLTVLSLALLGNLAGFLFFNFHPARVFMGDGGSLFLGFFLSASSVFLASRTNSVVGLALPALALGLPISDMIFAIVRRLIERRPIFAPDRNHLHHCLLDKGYSHRIVVAMMQTATILSATIGLAMLLVGGVWSAIAFAAALMPLVMIWRISGLRFRVWLENFRQSWILNRKSRKDTENFMKLQLYLREAGDFVEWWRVVRRAARFLGFSRVAIRIERSQDIVQSLFWECPRREENGKSDLTAMLQAWPFGDEPVVHVELEISVREGLEIAGRRISLLGRLLDDRSTHAIPPILTELRQPQPSRRIQADVAVALQASHIG